MTELVLSVTYGPGGADDTPTRNVAEQAVAVQDGDTWHIETRDGAGQVLETRPATTAETAAIDERLNPPPEPEPADDRVAQLEAQLAALIDALGGMP